jgi:hypothetical protein
MNSVFTCVNYPTPIYEAHSLMHECQRQKNLQMLFLINCFVFVSFYFVSYLNVFEITFHKDYKTQITSTHTLQISCLCFS